MKRGMRLLVLGVLVLVAIGLSMVASVSGATAVELYHYDANHFAVRQFIFAGAAVLFGIFFLPRIDYHFLERREIAWGLAFLTLFALLSVWLPFLADDAHKGSSRWIRCGPIRVQPSEFVRVAVCILYARWCSAIRSRNEDFLHGIVLPLLCLLPVLGLLIKQPDFGSTCLTAAMVLALLYASGARLRHILAVAAVGGACLLILLFSDPEHRSRILSVYDSSKVDQESTHQVVESLKAFRRGGFTGVGYGNSRMKDIYLPENHTDFILAMTGEELGLVFTLAVVLANLMILYGGWTISRNCLDKFGKILAFGLTLHLCMAAAVNIAVVTRFAPTKGLALPFMSYGGSNLLASFIVLGLLLSVGRHGQTSLQGKPILLQT